MGLYQVGDRVIVRNDLNQIESYYMSGSREVSDIATRDMVGDLLLFVAQKAPVIRWMAAKRAHAGLIFESEYKISVHMYLQSS